MANRASAIIISKRHILLIHRIRARDRDRVGDRDQREYYVFPGGHIEEGESAEEACIREVLEETGLQTAWLSYAFDYTDPKKTAHFFVVEVVPGTLTLSGPEAQKRSEENQYLLEWLPLVKVGEYSLQPQAVRDALVRVATEDGPLREARDLAQRRERLQALLREGV